MRFQISDFQRKLIFSDHELTMACCGRGTGKSKGIAARIAYRNVAMGRSSMVGAPTYGMIKSTLMPDVEDWFNKFHVKVKVNWSEHTMETRYGRVVFLSGTRPDAPRGYTNFEDFVGDEGAYLPAAFIKNAILACRSSKGLSTTQTYTSTGRVGSQFNKWFKKPPIADNLLLTASTFDNPFTTDQYKRTAYESLLDTPEFLQQEIFGGLDAETLNLVFPPSKFSSFCLVGGGRPRCGIDFAYEGCDNTILTAVNDHRILDKRVISGNDDGTRAFEAFMQMHRQYNFEMVNKDHTGGFDEGFSVLMKINNVDVPQNNFNFGGASPEKKYENMRAFLAFNAKKMIENQGFYIGMEEYEDELVPQTYFINKSGKIQLTPKKQLKIQLGRSPDYADSLWLAMYKPKNLNNEQEPSIPAPSRRG